MHHTWPGNVRELRNLMAGLHCLAKSRSVTLTDLPPEVANPSAIKISAIKISEHKLSSIDGGPAQSHHPVPGASLKDAEVRLIERTMQLHHGNLSKAAIALGISRPTLYRKIESYRIKMT